MYINIATGKAIITIIRARLLFKFLKKEVLL